ncbi:PBP1A family penicillin-binding protein [Aerococcus agrisoli]|uniref:PBP1A family penicillin-binding protein n=1 Tax=Aerococcus agrisoli TaxID=2487350 RepID=A0A3N4GGK3_9LACT|nr:PBP1A family penicillin-binding protein [Aerococcus agrisoli]RPA60537.1 PBP1A family penicillin-binding protein [Aerococcus agrisoli]
MRNNFESNDHDIYSTDSKDSLWQKFRKLWKKLRLTRWIIFFVLAFGFVFESYLLIGAKTTDISDLPAKLQVTTEFYDQDGTYAGEISNDSGTYVSLDEISTNIQDAVISTEDKRFYSHNGFDIIGIGRAAVGYITSGGIVGGGSTITQQLVKNAFLDNDQSIIRKLKELFLAFEIEKNYTKQEILEMYLNNAYFGNGAYGVEDASQKYFGMSASEVPVEDAAVIAGALKGPTIYNPVDDYDATLERRDTILQLMADNEFLTQEEADAAIATEMVQMNNEIANDAYAYPYYFDAVINEAINKFGLTEEDIMNGNYKIYTNLNQTYQTEMQTAYADTTVFPTSPSGEPAQSASVMMDPTTGGVYATVGGTGEYTFRGYNRGTQISRNPASTIKPLLVYALALENGYTAQSVIPDEVMTYGDGYAPENWNFESVGEILLWDAVAKSKNTSAVWMMNEMGVDASLEQLAKFGIPYVEADKNLTTALGSIENGVSPLQMASAYTAFANEGVRSEGYFITRIEDQQGNVVVEEQEPTQNQAVSAEVAEEMTSILLSVYDEGGTGATIEPEGYEVAGKTGSNESQDSTLGNSDEWDIAYTPDFVLATWYGFDETTEDSYLWYGSTSTSKTAFSAILTPLLQASPGTAFTIESAYAEYNQLQAEEDAASESSSSDESTGENNDSTGNVLDSVIQGAQDFFQGLFGSGE